MATVLIRHQNFHVVLFLIVNNFLHALFNKTGKEAAFSTPSNRRQKHDMICWNNFSLNTLLNSKMSPDGSRFATSDSRYCAWLQHLPIWMKCVSFNPPQQSCPDQKQWWLITWLHKCYITTSKLESRLSTVILRRGEGRGGERFLYSLIMHFSTRLANDASKSYFRRPMIADKYMTWSVKIYTDLYGLTALKISKQGRS